MSSTGTRTAWPGLLGAFLALASPADTAATLVRAGVDHLAVGMSAERAFHGVAPGSSVVKCSISIDASLIISRASSSA